MTPVFEALRGSEFLSASTEPQRITSSGEALLRLVERAEYIAPSSDALETQVSFSSTGVERHVKDSYGGARGIRTLDTVGPTRRTQRNSSRSASETFRQTDRQH